MDMNLIGNIVWLVFGGLLLAIAYFIQGLVLCLTIIGIPFGLQLFKFGMYSLSPFGHEMVYEESQPGCLTEVMNLIWILCGWWEIALLHLVLGILFCFTIIGIPLGRQHFKIAAASLFPFGKELR